MEVRYGKYNLELERITRWDHRDIYSDDGADYLYTHHHLTVQCVFNPAATGQPDTAAFSIRSIRDDLKNPRQILTVTIGGIVVLQSPSPRDKLGAYFTDCRNGPNPINVNIIEVVGTKTMIVVFEIETWINECLDYPRVPLLSHRWEMTHDIDQEHYTTRTITGTAIFRGDYLLNDPARPVLVPDDFRVGLFHPLPMNFQREKISVTAASDGLSVRYSVIDNEKPINLNYNNPINRIEGFFRGGYDFSHYNPWTLSVTPLQYRSIVIRVWGRRTTTRAQLVKGAVKALASFNFDFSLNANDQKRYYKADITIDIVNKFVEISMGVHVSGIGSAAFVNIDEAFNGGPSSIDVNAFPEDIVYTATTVGGLFGIVTTSVPGGTIAKVASFANANGLPDNPQPPNASGSRGTYVGRMVAQSLSVPCKTPAKPPQYMPARDFQP